MPIEILFPAYLVNKHSVVARSLKIEQIQRISVYQLEL